VPCTLCNNALYECPRCGKCLPCKHDIMKDFHWVCPDDNEEIYIWPGPDGPKWKSRDEEVID
jgi:hypothetical protein